MFATRTAANKRGSLTTPPVATIAAAAVAHAKAATMTARSEPRSGVPNAESRSSTSSSSCSKPTPRLTAERFRGIATPSRFGDFRLAQELASYKEASGPSKRFKQERSVLPIAEDVRGVGDPGPMERLVRFPVKTILTVLGLIVAVWALLHVIVAARSVIVCILIAIFLTLAINPLVAWLMRRGMRSRGVAARDGLPDRARRHRRRSASRSSRRSSTT